MNQRQRAALAGKYQSDGMSGSSPQKLLLAVFDRLGRDLDAAIVAIEANNVEAAHKFLVNAQDLVFELNLALEPDVWPAALELRSVYEHLLDLLVEANLDKSVDKVQRCIAIVEPLAESWREAHDALNQQKVAAGLAAGNAATGNAAAAYGGRT
ncbi:MAG: flagellar export chaperone FliS [Actinomycetota bacterium]